MPSPSKKTSEINLLKKFEAPDEELLNLFEIIGMGMLYVSNDGCIVSSNQTARRILCFTDLDLEGRYINEQNWDFYHGDGSHLSADQHPVIVAARSGEIVSNFALGIRKRSDKNLVWITITAIPLVVQKPDFPGLICVTLQNITEQKNTQHKLIEREKELQAFYQVTNISESEEDSAVSLYQRIIEFLPKSWQYPEIACGRIILNGNEFLTDNFKVTPWLQSASIKLDGVFSGSIDIGYLEERPALDEGPFLKEERLLLDSIAERIGRITERNHTLELLNQKNEIIELALQASNLGTWKQFFDKNMMILDEIAQQHYGFHSNQVTESEIIQRIHPDDLQKFLDNYKKSVQIGYTGSINTEHRIIHPDGTVKWLEVYARLKYTKTAEGFIPLSSVGTSKDITERKTAELLLERNTRSLKMLSHCNKVLVKAEIEKELIQEICRICVEDGNYMMSWVGYAEENPQKSVRPVAEFGFEEGYLNSINITWGDDELGQGPTGTAIRTNQPSIAQDIQNDPRFKPWRQAAILRGYGSSIGLPLMVGGRTIGALMLYDRAPDAFQPDELNLLIELSNDLSYGIESIRIREQQIRLVQELKISEERYKLAQKSARIGSWEWEIQEDKVFWSHEMYDLFNKKYGEFFPTISSMLDCILIEDRQRITTLFLHPDNTGIPFDIEFRIFGADSQIKWINSKGNVICNQLNQPVMLAGTMQDITSRRFTEEALKLSNQNYKLISENASDVILVMDAETQKFVYISPSVQNLRGYAPEEVLNQSMRDALTPSSFEIAEKLLKEYIENFQEGRSFENTPIELDQIRKDGSIVTTELSTTLAYSESGRLQVIGISRDITDRKKNEEALRISSDTTRAIFDATLESVFLIDTQGVVIAVNKTGAERLNLTRSELIGKFLFTFFPPDLAKSRFEKMKLVINTRKPLIYEDNRAGMRFQLNCYPVFNISGEVINIVINARDITDAYNAQQVLQNSEATQRALLEAITESVLLIKPDGSGVMTNSKTLERLKITGDDFKNCNLFDLLPKDVSDSRRKQVDTVVKTRQPIRFEDLRYDRYILNSINPIQDINGEVSQLAIFGFDITDLKKAEEQLLRSERRNKTLIDAIPDMLFRIKRDGIMVDYHGKSTDKLYASPENFIGKKVSEVLPADISGKIMNAVNLAFIENKLQTVEYSLWIEEDEGIFEGRVVPSDEDEAVMTVRDITSQKKMENEIRENEEKYRVLMQSLDTVVSTIDRQGKILYLNDVGAKMLEGNPEEFIGKTIFECFPEHVAEPTLKSAQRVFDENNSFTEEALIQVKSGLRWFRSAYVPIHDKNGEVFSVLVNSTDIHELKSIQQRLLDLNRSLEEKIVERTAELQDLYDNAPSGYHSLDANGVFQFINSTELRWLGYNKEEVIGKLNISELLIPDEMLTFREAFTRLIQEGQIINLELTMRRKDGSHFEVEINSTAIYDDNGNYINDRSTMIDVTERKKSQEALKHSEANYRALFQKSNDGVFLMAADGTELAANKQALNMIGYSEEEYDLIKQSGNDVFIPEEERSDANVFFDSVLKGETVPPYERTFITKNGTRIDTEVNLTAIRDENGKILFVQSVVRDITRRKAIDNELRRINNLSDTALELANAGYWFVPLDGKEIFISSDRVIKIQGDHFHHDYIYDFQADILKQIKAVDPQTAKIVNQKLKDVFYGRNRRFEAEFQYKRPIDGNIIWIHSIGNTTFDQEGTAVGVIGVSQDVTLQKQMAIDLHKAKEAAEAANKAKSAFLANMSHEIRTPMNAILGFGQILQKDQSMTEKNRNYLSIINRSGEHLLDLINEILEMSKIEAGQVTYHPSIFNIQQLIEDIHSMFDLRLAAKNLFFKIELSPDLPEYIISDENKVKEILINLIGNAVKFTNEGGLTIRCRSELDRSNSDSKELLLFLEIEDTGIGISPEDMPKLFKAFEQTRSGAQMNGGTGLGLAISQSHARLLGGDITITSTIGEGSCFRVLLKVQKGEEVIGLAVGKGKKVSAVKPGIKEIRVLIADDNDENSLILSELLEPIGIMTQRVNDGKSAVEAVGTWRPDLVLMDLRMPVLDGFSAAKKIKATPVGKNIPIVAVTASILELDRDKVWKSGMTGYLRKPFKADELFTILESSLGEIFVYTEEDITSFNGNENEKNSLIQGDITIIPDELIDQMKIATINAHFEDLITLIDKVSDYSPRVAAHLSNLANDYQYDSLLRLFTKGENG